MRLRPWALAIFGLFLAGMHPHVVLPGVEEGPLAVDGPLLTAVPSYVRVEVGPGEERRVGLTLTALAPTTLLAAEVDCRCVSLVEPTPRALPQGVTTLQVRVIGLLPGTKTMTLRTTAGPRVITIQVAVPGAADAMAILTSLALEAAPEHLGVIAIVHDLRGKLRNCGCATGSLGGVGYLARLPATLREAGFAHVRCVLTGEIDGDHPGLGKALGWEIAPREVVVSATPAEELAKPEVLAVIDTSDGTSTPAHQKIVRPVLDGGAVAILLLVDDHGRIQSHHVLPIDQSLPVDAHITAGFPEPQTIWVDAQASAATTCLACHGAAHAAWSASGHARAWADLPVISRVDTCVICHSTAQAGSTVRAPAVQCTACHLGAEAHAAAPTTHPTGMTDCRSCHDAIHHPGFDPVLGWARIQHGK